MKKERIIEILYLCATVFFLWICIGKSSDAPAKEAISDGITPGLPEHTEEYITPSIVTPTMSEADDVASKGQAVVATSTPLPENNAAPSEVPTPTAGGANAEAITPTSHPTEAGEQPPTKAPEPTESLISSGKLPGASEIKNENYEGYDNKLNEWWFVRKENHSPSGSGEGFPIAPYSAYYRDTEVTEEDRVVYLTFDCGYENGFTPSILDTLAEQGVKAMFFVTKDFVVKNPDYVKRMKEEGHLVGNHTVRHLSSPSLTPEELEAELSEVAKTMFELTGYSIDPFFRPPMGEYSERTLKATQDMGYSSIFWSIAYYDYDVNNQPGKAYVVDHINTYHHNGTIILMHNTSRSNAEALTEVVELLKGEGYRFGALTEVVGE